MKILIDDIRLNLLLEQKKNYIGKRVAWDSVLSACSFLLSAVFASYKDIWIIPSLAFKVFFIMLGITFTVKSIYDIFDGLRNYYSYEDLPKDINTLNEITHNHSIIAIRDSFNEYPNRFLVYDDPQWNCMLFVNYKDNINNESFIKEHISRELKVNISDITVDYISQTISEKISGRDNQRKVYCHKLFSTKIENMPENMKSDTFTYDGRTYHWESIVELENDSKAMEKNSDIIRFVKENI